MQGVEKRSFAAAQDDKGDDLAEQGHDNFYCTLTKNLTMDGMIFANKASAKPIAA